MSMVQQIRDASTEDLRDRARTARDLAEAWHILLAILADELESLAAEREREAAPQASAAD